MGCFLLLRIRRYTEVAEGACFTKEDGNGSLVEVVPLLSPYFEENYMSLFIEKISPDFPVGNAAGHCKSVDEVRQLAKSAAQFIVIGSITVEERAGNPGNTFNGSSLNSLGLPNSGIKKILVQAKEMIDTAHNAGKPIILSVAGFSPSEYLELSCAAHEVRFDGVELNLGCPNVTDGGKRKPIASFDLPLMEEIVTMASTAVRVHDPNFFVLVKVSPMSNPLQIIDAAQLLARCNIDAVVTQNTVPNCLLFSDDGSPQIQTPDKTGWAGLSGGAVKAQALGQVSQWRRALDACGANHRQVWGVGGVQSGRDVRDMQRAGASVVQVGTAYFVGGAKVFGDIANEYLNF